MRSYQYNDIDQYGIVQSYLMFKVNLTAAVPPHKRNVFFIPIEQCTQSTPGLKELDCLGAGN